MRDKRRKKEIKTGYCHIRINEEDRNMLQFVRNQTGENLSGSLERASE